MVLTNLVEQSKVSAVRSLASFVHNRILTVIFFRRSQEGLAGLKSIGKAGKAVTKQLGRTLVKISDSPDKRGHEKLFLVQNPQLFARKLKEKDAKTHIDATATNDLGLDTGMLWYYLSHELFFLKNVRANHQSIIGFYS